MSQNVKLYFLNRNKGPSLGLLTLLRTTLTLLGTPLSLVGMPLTHSGIPNHPPWNARILTRIPLSCTIPPSIHNTSHMDPKALQGRIQDSKRGGGEPQKSVNVSRHYKFMIAQLEIKKRPLNPQFYVTKKFFT